MLCPPFAENRREKQLGLLEISCFPTKNDFQAEATKKSTISGKPSIDLHFLASFKI